MSSVTHSQHADSSAWVADVRAQMNLYADVVKNPLWRDPCFWSKLISVRLDVSAKDLTDCTCNAEV